ncbi:transposase [Leptospira borgpetersenii]|uniref:Transposase n=1 Tax=Leptospira borgpetersenii serovar Pomona str. 200901868 TaxID=1192866 RepID=M6VV91_LEPBO|nr:transposase [Leptospira borgpetersenii]EMO60785.1 transposase [Leptospira borgpetersenii serovar Pomona str. 200901868]MBE8364504.1 transposase [Leptospira borgpetersenii serovar Balcanica]MBE8366491.1 transposase [Leptospira borgpetersenii serovar Balcanica]MBE8423588.1 transposase [Leptospira borgpetersenii serovar Balcanica]MBF3350685.1 transposase [Leptospira borgpetersenii serovar Balcanica]
MLKSNKSLGQLSQELGISINTLRNWKKKYLTDDGPFRDALQEKVDRLEKQLAEVTEEREILKKSVAIFLKPRK